jgi:hypothetical protein
MTRLRTRPALTVATSGSGHFLALAEEDPDPGAAGVTYRDPARTHGDAGGRDLAKGAQEVEVTRGVGALGLVRALEKTK